jgi:hypothetical protein
MPRRSRPSSQPLEPLGIGLPLTESRILLAATWIKDTTLLYGGSISTAFTVAGVFAQGLEQEMIRRASNSPDPIE